MVFCGNKRFWRLELGKPGPLVLRKNVWYTENTKDPGRGRTAIMKRKTSLTQFALLMGICLLFFGCAHGNPPEETTFTPTTIPTEIFRPTLLERAEPWEGAEELLLLPVDELEL